MVKESRNLSAESRKAQMEMQNKEKNKGYLKAD